MSTSWSFWVILLLLFDEINCLSAHVLNCFSFNAVEVNMKHLTSHFNQSILLLAPRLRELGSISVLLKQLELLFSYLASRFPRNRVSNHAKLQLLIILVFCCLTSNFIIFLAGSILSTTPELWLQPKPLTVRSGMIVSEIHMQISLYWLGLAVFSFIFQTQTIFVSNFSSNSLSVSEDFNVSQDCNE